VTIAQLPIESVTTPLPSALLSWGPSPSQGTREGRRFGFDQITPDIERPRLPTAADRALVDLFRGAGLRAIDTRVPPPPTDEIKELPNPPNVVQLIRNWSGLSMADVASLLRLSRRAAYDRLGGVRATLSNESHEAWVVDVLNRLRSKLDPPRLRRWLYLGDPPSFELIVAGEQGPLETRVAAELAANLPRLRRLNENEAGPAVSSLSRSMIAAELTRFASPAYPENERTARPPREMLFGDIEE
jgi:hypothetical protein